ncbi:MAG: hypothetical protein ABIP74_00290 [Candidatus Saccharimonas sp.]
MLGWRIVMLGAIALYGGAIVDCKPLMGVAALAVWGGVVTSLVERVDRPLFQGFFKIRY